MEPWFTPEQWIQAAGEKGGRGARDARDLFLEGDNVRPFYALLRR